MPLNGESIQISGSSEITISYVSTSAQSYSNFKVSFSYIDTEIPSENSKSRTKINFNLILILTSLLISVLIVVIAILSAIQCKKPKDKPKSAEKKVVIFSDQPVLFEPVVSPQRRKPVHNRSSTYQINKMQFQQSEIKNVHYSGFYNFQQL